MSEKLSQGRFESVTPQEAEQRLQAAGFRPGVQVVLTKTKILAGESSSIPVGFQATGALGNAVTTGESVTIVGASSTTSPVRRIEMRNEAYYIFTETSEYEIAINVARRTKEGLTQQSLGLDLGGIDVVDQFGGKGLDGDKLMRAAEDWLPILESYGMHEGDTVEFFAEKPRIGTVVVGRVPGKEKVVQIMDEKGNPWSIMPLVIDGAGYIKKK